MQIQSHLSSNAARLAQLGAALAQDEDEALIHVPAKRGRDERLSAPELRKAAAIRLSADLPGDDASRIKVAREAMIAAHEAVLADDEAAFTAAVELYDAVIYALTDFSFFGSEVDQGGGQRLREALAAAPGQVPLWGQAGEFLVDHAGIRAVVKMHGGFGTCSFASLNAACVSGLFVSDTGFLSLTGAKPVLGCAVDEAARGWLAFEIENRGRVTIGRAFRDRDFAGRYPWLAPGKAASAPVYQESTGQMAFGF